MFVIGTTEIQFIAYLQLIRNRLRSLNSMMVNFNYAKNLIKHNRNFDDINEDILNTMALMNASKTCKTVAEKQKQDYWEKFIKYMANKCGRSNTIMDSEMKFALPKRTTAISTVPKSTVRKQKGFKDFNQTWCVAALERNANDSQYLSQHLSNDITQMIIKTQKIYMKLEKVSALINLSYGIPIMFILVIKFTTLTALLYFCCMIIIK